MDQGLAKWNRLREKYKFNVRDWAFETDGMDPDEDELEGEARQRPERKRPVVAKATTATDQRQQMSI